METPRNPGDQKLTMRVCVLLVAAALVQDATPQVPAWRAAIEPVMLVLMGVIIAAVVLALYLPLFELTSVVGG